MKKLAGDLYEVEENLVTNVEEADPEEVVLLDDDAKTHDEDSSNKYEREVNDASNDNLDVTLEAETEHEEKSGDKEGEAGLSDSMREFDCCLLGHSDASYHKEEDTSSAGEADEVDSDFVKVGKEAIAKNEKSQEIVINNVKNVNETFTAPAEVVDLVKVNNTKTLQRRGPVSQSRHLQC